MLYHFNERTTKNSCMGYLEVDVSKFINLMGTIMLSPHGFIIGKVRLENRTGLSNSEIAKPIFTCRECNKEVPIEEVGIECYHCYEVLKHNQLFFLENSGGIFRKKRLKDLDEADELKIIPVENVIREFTAQFIS